MHAVYEGILYIHCMLYCIKLGLLQLWLMTSSCDYTQSFFTSPWSCQQECCRVMLYTEHTNYTGTLGAAGKAVDWINFDLFNNFWGVSTSTLIFQHTGGTLVRYQEGVPKQRAITPGHARHLKPGCSILMGESSRCEVLLLTWLECKTGFLFMYTWPGLS